MTVRDLITELEKIENKDMNIKYFDVDTYNYRTLDVRFEEEEIANGCGWNKTIVMRGEY